MLWHSYNNALHLFNKAKCQLFRSIMNFKNLKITWISSAGQPASLPACWPAIRPGSARCMAPEIQHSKGYPFPFTKLLFRRQFIHCAMVILLYFLPYRLECVNNFSVTTTFHTRCKQVQ